MKSESGAMEGHDMSSGSVNVSPEKQQLVGIRTAVAEIRPLVKKIRTVGIVTYDETKVAQVFTKVDGWIDKLYVNYTGKLVEKGQPLFTLYSPDLVATQDEYLLALQAKESLASSSLKEISAGSISLLESTRRRLSLWDISDEQIAELQKTREPKRNLTFYSPISGFVIKKDAVQGMKVMPDKELYTITDLSTVWVNADIYEFELANVRLGQRATIALSYFPGQTFSGKVLGSHRFSKKKPVPRRFDLSSLTVTSSSSRRCTPMWKSKWMAERNWRSPMRRFWIPVSEKSSLSTKVKGAMHPRRSSSVANTTATTKYSPASPQESESSRARVFSWIPKAG